MPKKSKLARFAFCVLRFNKTRGAFTLIELLIASSILAIVMVTIFSAFHSGIFGFRNIDETIEAHQAARFILEQMSLDLKNSFNYKDSGKNAKFIGRGQEISFLALVDTFSHSSLVREFAFVSYKLENNKLFRLCRKAHESLNKNSQIQAEELIDNIDIAFQYSNGKISEENQKMEFKDTWAGQDGPADEQEFLPAVVKINLTVHPASGRKTGEKEKRGQKFERTIYLPLAE